MDQEKIYRKKTGNIYIKRWLYRERKKKLVCGNHGLLDEDRKTHVIKHTNPQANILVLIKKKNVVWKKENITKR